MRTCRKIRQVQLILLKYFRNHEPLPEIEVLITKADDKPKKTPLILSEAFVKWLCTAISDIRKLVEAEDENLANSIAVDSACAVIQQLESGISLDRAMHSLWDRVKCQNVDLGTRIQDYLSKIFVDCPVDLTLPEFDKKPFDYESVCKGSLLKALPLEAEDDPIPLDYLRTYVDNQVFDDCIKIIENGVSNIQDRIEKYGWTPDKPELLNKVIGNDVLNFEFSGTAGGGKSVTVDALAAAFGMPRGITNMSPYVEDSEFQGTPKLIGKEFEFVETVFLKRFTRPGIILIDEINLANPGVVALLNSALIYPFCIKRDGFEPVYRHPLCIVMAAHNVGLSGTQPMNEAFLRRLRFPFYMESQTPEEMANILLKKFA